MRKQDAFFEAVDSSRPLCCRYLLVALDAVPIQIGNAEGFHQKVVYWALGALTDGQHEVLGLWVRPASDVSAWTAVSKDLEDRGVTQVRMTLGARNECLGSAFSGVGVLPALSEREDLRGLPTRTRRYAAEGLRVAQDMHMKVTQTVRRRGCFRDAIDAASCVACSLARAQGGPRDAATRRRSSRRSPNTVTTRTYAGSLNGVADPVG